MLFVSFLSKAQIVDFPDPNFKTAVLNHNPIIDTNGDNEIQVSEAMAFGGVFDVGNENINDLTGIEAFENIIVLLCQFNNLTMLDISQNQQLSSLRADNNNLQEIILPQSTTLSSLQISDNQLTNLDVSELSNLNQLFARRNNIDVIALEFNAIITAIDLSENPVAQLNFTNNPLLQFLDISETEISLLDISQNPNVIILRAASLAITDLDLSNNPEIELLDISDNNFTSFDFSILPNLTFVEAGFSAYEQLDFSENPLLCRVVIEFNEQLVSVNLRNGSNSELVNPQGCSVSSGQVSVNGPSGLFASNNPNLLEICVDDITFAQQNFTDIPSQTTFIDNCTLSISENLSDIVTVYPNPANDHIQLNSKLSIDRIDIYDILGKKMKRYSITDNRVDISNLTTGMYFIHINTSANIQTLPFIKK